MFLLLKFACLRVSLVDVNLLGSSFNFNYFCFRIFSGGFLLLFPNFFYFCMAAQLSWFSDYLKFCPLLFILLPWGCFISCFNLFFSYSFSISILILSLRIIVHWYKLTWFVVHSPLTFRYFCILPFFGVFLLFIHSLVHHFFCSSRLPNFLSILSSLVLFTFRESVSCFYLLFIPSRSFFVFLSRRFYLLSSVYFRTSPFFLSSRIKDLWFWEYP